jgi:peptide/nickel transport system permease protein
VSLHFYLVRRVARFGLMLVGLSVLTFVVSHVVPSDPVGLAAGRGATAFQLEAIRTAYGTGEPLPLQYLRYLENVVHGNLGRSLMSGHAVVDDLLAFVPNTVELVLGALLIAVGTGVPSGVAAAVWRGQWPAQLTRVCAVGALSLPAFWLAIVLQLGLAMTLHLLPVDGVYDARTALPAGHTGLLVVDALLDGDFHAFAIAAQHLVLPAVALAVGPSAFIGRSLGADVCESLASDWARMLRSNGLPEWVILLKYVLKTCAIATVVRLANVAGYCLGGSIVIETVFDWPGVGLYAASSALTRDFQPIIGVALVAGLFFLVVNLLTDVAHGILDPRARFQ